MLYINDERKFTSQLYLISSPTNLKEGTGNEDYRWCMWVQNLIYTSCPQAFKFLIVYDETSALLSW